MKEKKNNFLTFNLKSLIKKNIVGLSSYLSARLEKKINNKSIFLDANENSFGSTFLYKNTYHRYPDPLQEKLKKKISIIKEIPIYNIFLGNGSDEIIDIIYKIFVRPIIDNVILFPPTYGMYEISGKINNAKIIQIPLTNKNYQLDIKKIKNSINYYSKVIFFCSPNNPTGNNINKEDIEYFIQNFHGIVVIDEAYIDFSESDSFIKKITKYPNLIIIQTLSKAWGLAGIRIGIGIASKEIIHWMNKVKYPYNISNISQKIAIKALENKDVFLLNLKNILLEKEYLKNSLNEIDIIDKIYPSSTNFILVKIKSSSKELYNFLIKKKIIVRDRSKVILCKNCLRITVGTHKENKSFIHAIKEY